MAQHLAMDGRLVRATARQLRVGFTTGTCAAAAAKAATVALCSGKRLSEVDVLLPSAERVILPVLEVFCEPGRASAKIRKDSGDDPDVTDQLVIHAVVEFAEGCDVVLRAGQGIGMVTLPGLAVPPGEPAINPVPRRQIVAAARETTDRGLVITLSIPGGEEVALRTFNPRLGVIGGLSILGTDGRVRPFSDARLVAALVLGVDVARANGVDEPVLVPGHLGRRHALLSLGCTPIQVIEVGNAIGAMLDRCVERGIKRVLLLGHPGKLAKLAAGQFDTHSSRSSPAVETVLRLGRELGLRFATSLPTTEAVFLTLSEADRKKLGCFVADAVRDGVVRRHPSLTVAVWLTDLGGNQLGTSGELTPWLR